MALYLGTSSKAVSMHIERRWIRVHSAALDLCTFSGAGSLYIQRHWICVHSAALDLLRTSNGADLINWRPESVWRVPAE